MNDSRSKEKIVSLVQDLLLKKKVNVSFSLAGLDKAFKGEAPRKKGLQVLEALAEVLGNDLSSFAELEAVSA